MITLPRGLLLYIAESVGERGEGRANALYRDDNVAERVNALYS
jgi:hypothetical protein